jgi:hypothetical protein
MGMKRYKKLLFQVGVLLFICALFIYFIEQRKQFISIDFSKHYTNNKTIELAGFEEGERWQGNYSYDSERVMEGKSSITLSSWYGKENSIESTQDTVLPSEYSKGYLSVYVADKKDIESLASLSLSLMGTNDQKKEYTLTPLIQVGWNRIAIQIPLWKRVTKKVFTVVSKPGTIAEVNLDRLWVENTSIYTSDIFPTKSQSLSLRTIGTRTYLFSASSTGEDYVISSPSTLQRGSVTISLIPEHAREIRLSLNGTSFKLGGRNMNECFLFKNNNLDTTKILQKTSGKDDLYVFLKAETQKGNIIYSLSNNGVDYEVCGTLPSTQRTHIQLSLQGSYLIDSYSAEY